MKRILPILITAIMIVMVPVMVSANDTPDNTPGGQLTAASIIGDPIHSGECGSNGYKIVWELYEDGTLLFKGTGNMMDFESDGGPWCMFKNQITNVVIQSGISSIGNNAFYQCQGITSVSIPDTLNRIGISSFWDTGRLLNMYIPDSVTKIDNAQFNRSTKLWCQAESKPTDWSLGSGYTVMYGVSKPEYEFWISLNGEETSVEIPAGFTFIPNDAFKNNRNLQSVTIPDTINRIGSYAFYSCTSLTGVTIPDGVTSIGSYAFYYCRSLTGVSIPDGVTSIGAKAFNMCSSMTNLFIPSSVTTLENISFYNNCKVWCQAKSKPEGWGNVDGNVVYGVEKADYDFFISLTGKETSVEIPDGVKNIPDKTFENNENLTSVTIPDGVTNIGNNAFYYCSMLQDITLPDTLTSIGDGAFEGCQLIEKLTIPASVSSIGANAFTTCYRLKHIYVPSTVTSIGDEAFHDTTNVWCEPAVKPEGWGILSTADNIAFGVDKSEYEFWNNLDSEAKSIEIPAGCKKIPIRAFKGFMNLTDLTIPESVTGIADEAFSYCKSLTSLPVTDRITGIGASAFEGCKGLTNITIPDSVTTIGDKAFDKCSLKSVVIPSTVELISSRAFDENENCLIYCGHESQPENWGEDWSGTAKVIYSFNSDTFSKLTMNISTSTYTYNGHQCRPGVTVKNGYGIELSCGSDYIVTYPSSSKYVGSYTVTVTGAGDYKGKKLSNTFTVIPKGTSISKLTRGKKAITVSWKKLTTQTTGYQIRYSMKSTMASSKVVTVSKNSTTSRKISKLKAKKKYYVQIRTYKTVKGKRYYSAWSSKKSVTTK